MAVPQADRAFYLGLLGYSSLDAFRKDHADAFVAGSIYEGKAYGYPMRFYGLQNYVNTKQFKEVGLDPVKDEPKTWDELGEVAKRLTIKKGDKFERQGFKFAMHAAQWTMMQFNPILLQAGGQWFDNSGKCTVNNAAGVKAMQIRAAIAKIRRRRPGRLACDAADSVDGLAAGALLDVQLGPARLGGDQADQPDDGE